MHALVCVVVSALLLLVSAAPPAGAVTSPESTAAAARCGKGLERVKLRSGGKTKSRCVRKCKAGFVRKFTNRRARTKCVRKALPPAAQTPAAPGTTPAAPGETTTPAPGTTTTPPPAPQDPRERARALLRHRILTYYKGSTNYSSSTEKRITFCGDGSFAYFYRYDSSGGSGSVGSETHANGTWDVDEAEFNDSMGSMRAIVSYKSNDQSSLADGRILVEALGEKVWVDGEEWGYATASC